MSSTLNVDVCTAISGVITLGNLMLKEVSILSCGLTMRGLLDMERVK